MGLLLCMADTHLHLLLAGNVGFLDRWSLVLSHRDIAWLLSLVQLRRKNGINQNYFYKSRINFCS
jgi:hypothetical protein